jgi:CheY-like chemotaxis protein
MLELEKLNMETQCAAETRRAALEYLDGPDLSSQVRKEAYPLTVSVRETAARHPLRILLAEDNIVNQRVAVGLLSKLGYRADVVADGNEAVDAVLRIPYDLVLMDIQMPELDGEQAALRIRKEAPAERQPWIVAMTANVMKGDRERYLSHGMNDYISKPIRVEALVEVLRSVPPLASRETRA